MSVTMVGYPRKFHRSQRDNRRGDGNLRGQGLGWKNSDPRGRTLLDYTLEVAAFGYVTEGRRTAQSCCRNSL